jgi:type I restriction enzyme S subunit
MNLTPLLASWSSKRHPDTITYVDLSSVYENRIGKVNEQPFSDAPSRARRSLQDGDTIVGTVRPGNRAFAYIRRPAANLTGSTGFAVLSPKDEASAPFVYLAATRSDSIERLANLADGGAYPAVRPGAVSATPVIIPPAPVVAAFARITAPMLHKIGESRDAEATLIELRDTLLPRLISGKLRLLEIMEAAEATPG